MGGGTVEIVTPPCNDLHELDTVHNEALERLNRAAESMGPPLRILGLGMQPFSVPVSVCVVCSLSHGVTSFVKEPIM